MTDASQPTASQHESASQTGSQAGSQADGDEWIPTLPRRASSFEREAAAAEHEAAVADDEEAIQRSTVAAASSPAAESPTVNGAGAPSSESESAPSNGALVPKVLSLDDFASLREAIECADAQVKIGQYPSIPSDPTLTPRPMLTRVAESFGGASSLRA